MNMWIDVLLVVGVVLGGVQALRGRRLLTAALWLAVCSAMTATLLYRAGAEEAAVIELSVGAGLVTILFVFAIAVAGDEEMKGRAVVPPLAGWLLMVGAAVLLGRLALPGSVVTTAAAEPSFAVVMWEERSLDVLVQIGLIFAGVLGILGLLTEAEEKTVKGIGEVEEMKAAAVVVERKAGLNGHGRLEGVKVLEEERV